MRINPENTKLTVDLCNKPGLKEWLANQADKEDRTLQNFVARVLQDYRDLVEPKPPNQIIQGQQ